MHDSREYNFFVAGMRTVRTHAYVSSLPHMPQKRKYAAPRRVTIILETALHECAVRRADEFSFKGGFSEYVARLIQADRARKGRAVVNVNLNAA